MKIGSFNVENLFQRARALNLETWNDGREVLKQHAALNTLLNKESYSTADKAKMVALMIKLGIDKNDTGKFVVLRQNRGKLVKRPKSGDVQIIVDGRSDWVGWVDLVMEEVNETATQNTARVIHDVGADILAVVEAESRPALVQFSKHVLPAVDGVPYQHLMLIDGNDDRGIDVGVMARFPISYMISHVDDADKTGQIFSRDCAEYLFRTPAGNDLLVLVNHFKSKGYGSQESSDAKRKRQAARVKTIYEQRVAAGAKYVAVVGDLNDTPDSDPLAPLLKKTDLRDVSTHSGFDDGGRPGTFGNCTASNKIDYVLLSPKLFALTTAGGIFREGIWGGKNGTLFPQRYATITKAGEAASDHAAIWAEINLA
jgi:endonuclease/exonuclease/phosphatase family metal-dependent hydrolase